MAFRNIQKFACGHLKKELQVYKLRSVDKQEQVLKTRDFSMNVHEMKSTTSIHTSPKTVKNISSYNSYSFNNFFLKNSSCDTSTLRLQHNLSYEPKIDTSLRLYTLEQEPPISVIKFWPKIKFQNISVTPNGTTHQFVFNKKPKMTCSVKDDLLDIKIIRKINFLKAYKGSDQIKKEFFYKNEPFFKKKLKTNKKSLNSKENKKTEIVSKPIVSRGNVKKPTIHFPVPHTTLCESSKLPFVGCIRPGVLFQSVNRIYTNTEKPSYKSLRTVVNQILSSTEKNQKQFAMKKVNDVLRKDSFKFNFLEPKKFMFFEKKPSIKKKIFIPKNFINSTMNINVY